MTALRLRSWTKKSARTTVDTGFTYIGIDELAARLEETVKRKARRARLQERKKNGTYVRTRRDLKAKVSLAPVKLPSSGDGA